MADQSAWRRWAGRARTVLLLAGALLFLAWGVGAAAGFWLSDPGRRAVVAPTLLEQALLYGFWALAAAGVANLVAARRRGVALAALLFGAPALFLAVALASFGASAPYPLDEVEHDGARLILTVEPVPTDTVYGLWTARPGSWVWRELAEPRLTYSEGGAFGENPVLRLAGDRLLVGRGGLWTDCLVLEPRRDLCPEVVEGAYAQDAAVLRARSARIQALTGLAPPTGR